MDNDKTKKHQKENHKVNGIGCMLVALMPVLLIGFLSIRGQMKTTASVATNIIQLFTLQRTAPDSSKMKGSDLTVVVDQFKDAGFLFIKTVPKDDLIFSFRDNEVSDVTIGGVYINKADDSSWVTSTVRIYYHTQEGSGAEEQLIFNWEELLPYIALLISGASVIFIFIRNKSYN